MTYFLKSFYNHLPTFLQIVPSGTRGKSVCDSGFLDMEEAKEILQLQFCPWSLVSLAKEL